MDGLLLSHVIGRSREKFQAEKQASSAITVVVSLGISIYAVYLSWTCNTASGYPTVKKVIFAFFAFVFGLLYLIFYLLVNMGRCHAAPPANVR